jgi:hypothetical protein
MKNDRIAVPITAVVLGRLSSLWERVIRHATNTINISTETTLKEIFLNDFAIIILFNDFPLFYAS